MFFEKFILHATYYMLLANSAILADDLGSW